MAKSNHNDGSQTAHGSGQGLLDSLKPTVAWVAKSLDSSREGDGADTLTIRRLVSFAGSCVQVHGEIAWCKERNLRAYLKMRFHRLMMSNHSTPQNFRHARDGLKVRSCMGHTKLQAAMHCSQAALRVQAKPQPYPVKQSKQQKQQSPTQS